MSLSNFPQSSRPVKLFQTVFGPGVLLGTPTRTGSDTNWITTVTGTDEITGFNFPADLIAFLGPYAYAAVQSIPEIGVTAGDLTTFNSKFTNQIQATTWDGSPYSTVGNELLLQLDVRDTIGLTSLPGEVHNNPQTDLLIAASSASALANPLKEFYIRMDFFVPAGVNTQAGDTGSGRFWLFYDVKTGAYNSLNSVGDFRYLVGIYGASGVDKYQVIFDNNANGRGVIPSLSVGGIPISSGGSAVPTQEYMKIASDATVRTNCWHTLHIYTKRPANYLDTTTGIHQVVIEPHGYDRIVLCDINGDGYQAMGIENLPITRMFCGLNYTSCNLPNPFTLANLEFWTKPPFDLV